MVKVRENMTGWVMSEHGVPDSRLTVIQQTEDYIRPDGRHEARWLCECSCKENYRNRSLPKNNTSGIIGVGWYEDKNSWRARIEVDGQSIHLGYYAKKDDAIKIRLQAENKYFGEFAPQRHLFEQYEITTIQND